MAERLQQFREREVEPTREVPGYQNVQYSPDAFGAGIGRALGQLGSTLSDLGRMQAQVQDQKRSADASDALYRAKEEMRPWLFDQNDGMYSKQGGSAMGVERQGAAVLQDIQDRYIAELEDPKTQEAFRKLWQSYGDTTKDSLARHELKELGTYKAETAKATVLGSMQDAYSYYNDDKAIDKAISDAVGVIRANGFGQPPEALAAAEAEARSNIRLAVISRWAQENPYKALEYLEEHRDELAGKDHVTATSLVEAARANRAAQETVTRWTQTSATADAWYNAIEGAESSYRDGQVSSAGALGRMQVMPETAREVLQSLGRQEAYYSDAELRRVLLEDNNLNRLVGRTYYNQMLKRYNGDREAALVAYNAGPGSADAWLAHNAGRPAGQRDYNVPGRPKIKSETEPYVQKIFSAVGANRPPAGTRMTRQNWSLQHFRPDELMARQGEGQWVDARAAQGLDDLAGWMKSQFPGIAVKVNEGHDMSDGPTAGNRRGTRVTSDRPAGSATHSRHFQGDAFDVQVQGWTDEQKAAFIVEARKRGFGGIGFYGPDGHLHIDMGRERTWGRIPAWAKEALKTPQGAAPNGSASSGGAGGMGVPSASGGVAGDLPSGHSTALSAYGPMEPFSLPDALAEAQLIANPTERERTIALLRSEHAQMTSAQENSMKQLQQAAWEIVHGGSVRDIPPEMEVQLGPEFMSKMFAYERTRAEGGPTTNWELYTQLTTGLTTEDLAQIEPYEYRDQLADTEFKELAKAVAAARDELEGRSTDPAALRNMRTRSELLEDIATEMNWDMSKPAGKKAMAAFRRKFDQYTADEQARKVAAGKGELTNIELQDIADKLLITGSQRYPRGWGFWDSNEAKRGYVSPDPNNFTAAPNWEAVQDDDKKVLIDTYMRRSGGEPPTAEVALDIYNRAMVVWLGGRPEASDEEWDSFRENMETTFKRTFSQAELEKYYGRYLLEFLGR